MLRRRWSTVPLLMTLWGILWLDSAAQEPNRFVRLSGTVTERSGAPSQGSTVRTGDQSTVTDSLGHYSVLAEAGLRRVEVSQRQRAVFTVLLDLEEDRELDIALGETEAVIVQGGQDIQRPDPSTQGYSRTELLDANPGRPGVPLSVPGYPVQTASGGIKAPQYFAPGVAGDHGEPVAQFLSVHGFLFQNNLTANAHGNGYADPNFLIGSTLGGVLVDSAGYNARYGDHSLALAVTYDVRGRLPSFSSLTSDGRDGAVSAGWSPAEDRKEAAIAVEAMFGDGFLRRPEERQQYKVNAIRSWKRGGHELTGYGVGYYGLSRVPGLIPIGISVPGDTIDPRQSDLTHTAIALATDNWQIDAKHSLVSGGYFRTYSLSLRSNFGDGLIRQSEFRTVAGGSSTWTQALPGNWQWLAGLEVRRDAPRNLDLARLDQQNTFKLVTSNDLTITAASPFTAVVGRLAPHLHVYLGLRRDQLLFDNVDLLKAENSFTRWPGVTNPKVNLTLGEAVAARPQISFSFGNAYHANDPRIGSGSGQGTLLIESREFQAVILKPIAGTLLRLTVSQVSNSAELAKIDPDTGLQENVGPSRNRFLTLSAQRRFERGWLQMSWSEADARDRQSGAPVPEAPRTIVDAVGGVNRLPFQLQAKGELEYVKAKPLGDGFTGVPVREVRLALKRDFVEGRWSLSLDGQLNNGFSGQTLEILTTGSDPFARERPVGVPLRSYGSASLSYFFGR